jgi:hypothetical protein
MESLQRIALDFRKNPCSFGLCWPKTALVYKRDLGSRLLYVICYDDEGTTSFLEDRSLQEPIPNVSRRATWTFK